MTRQPHEPRTLAASLSAAVERWPNRPAVRFGEETLTYLELDRRARMYLGEFEEAGLGEGDVVLVMLENRLDFPALAAGAALGGIVLVAVNTEYVGGTLDHLLTQSGASVMVTSAPFVERIQAVRPASLRLILVCDGGPAAAGDRHGASFDPTVRPLALGRLGTPVRRAELDEIAIMYTSGTTGPPKGGVISERQAYTYAETVAEQLHLNESDVYYGTLPLFHVAGLWGVFYACVRRGAQCVVTPRFSVSGFWSDCDAVGATKTFLIGAMAQFLLRSEAGPARRGQLARALMCPLIDGLDEFRTHFEMTVTTSFASTEVNLCLAQPVDLDGDLGAGVGTSRPGFLTRIVRSDGAEAGVNEVGELWVRGQEPGLTFLRYHLNPEGTEETIVDGWTRSGDAFRVDEAGNLHFMDRLKDSVRKRGENISSFQVEAEVRSHPAVLECAVVGIDSADTEQDLVAFVQLRAGMSVTEDELRAHVQARAPRFMIPDQVRIVSGFPQTPTGKIKKYQLRELLERPVTASSDLRAAAMATGSTRRIRS